MGANRAGVRARARLKRRRREEMRLARKASEAEPTRTPSGVVGTVTKVAKGAAHQVGKLVKGAVEKVTGKAKE